MKNCTICGILKENTEFSVKTLDRRHSHCKACQKAKSQAHYNLNKSYYKSKAREAQAARNDWLWEFKSSLRCTICGEDHPSTLDFHHTDPKTKEISIAHAIKYSVKKVMDEASKCVVLCSNCHRKLHYNERITRGD